MKQFVRGLRAGLGIVALSLLAACGGDGDGGGASSVTVSGGVVKGPISGSTVCVFAITGGSKGNPVRVTASPGAGGTINTAGCYVTGADGSYSMALPAGTSGEVLLEASGGSFCSGESQVDAAGTCPAGQTLLTPGSTVLTTAVTLPAAGQVTTYVTPLTTAAVNNTTGSFTVTAFNSQFATLAGRIIGPGTDQTPATPPSGSNQPFLTQLSTYIVNGGTLSAAISALQQGTTTYPAPSGPPGGGTTTATVNAGLNGTYNLQFRARGGEGCGGTAGRCAFTEGQSVSLSVDAANGRLSLPGKALTSPFYRAGNTAEVIWLDAPNQIEYALTNNTSGVFSEINVGDASRFTPQGHPTFLGQIRTPDAPPNEALAALAGTYPKAYQYVGAEVDWTSVTIGADGSITFNGGSGYRPNVTTANRGTVTNFIGCCGFVAVQVTFDINQGANANGVNGDDRILLHVDQNGALRSIEYDTGNPASFPDNTGVRVGTVGALAHDGTVPPMSGNRITATVSNGSSTQTISTVIPFDSGSANGNDRGFTLNAPDTTATWTIQLAPGGVLATNTDYPCRVSPAVNNEIFLTVGGQQYAARSGGRCTVRLLEYSYSGSGNQVTNVRGTFAAELVDTSRQNRPPFVTVNGVFQFNRF